MTTLSQDSYLNAKDAIFLLENPKPPSGGDFLNGNLNIRGVQGETALTVLGDSDLSGNVNVSGNMIISENLAVLGTGAFSEDVNISGGLTVDLNVDIKQNLKLGGDFSIPYQEIPSAPTSLRMGSGVLLVNPAGPEEVPLTVILNSSIKTTSFIFLQRTGLQTVPDTAGVLSVEVTPLVGLSATVTSSAVDDVGATFNYWIIDGIPVGP